MIKQARFTIRGKQRLENDDDAVELMTSGEFEHLPDRCRIIYKESELTGMDGVRTEIELFGTEKVVLRRAGTFVSEMIFERGARHICHYDTPAGAMQLTVSTQNIHNKVTASGGFLNLSYTLEVNQQLLSENEFSLTVSL